MSAELRVLRAAEVAAPAPDQPRWLIESLWAAGAVGVIGGAPKCCKSWLALEMAVAVASGRPCLGRYAVGGVGPALVFAAEDGPLGARERLEQLAAARGADFPTLDVRLIVEPSLRLDFERDQDRLRATVERHRPRLLVLDPWVRLQRVHENDATEVSAVLSSLRALSRAFEVAIALVHHARKGPMEDGGQSLRGSSDFHAWGDSNLYLARRRDGLVLSIEHRAAAAPPPVGLLLENGQGPVRLEVRDAAATPGAPDAATPLEPTLTQRILECLKDGAPHRHDALRAELRVRSQHLAAALRDLESSGQISRTADGWIIEP